MIFNSKKCEFLRVPNKKHIILYNYQIANYPKEVDYVKYLGVTIDQHLTWNEHIKHLNIK